MSIESEPAPIGFAVRKKLAPGMRGEYERFHRAIPAHLHTAMQEAGVTGWSIFADGDVLTHVVTALNRDRLVRELDASSVNIRWQRQAARFLLDGVEPRQQDQLGVLIWDFSWPTR